MSYTPEDALEILRKARMDFTNGQAKITEAMNAISAIATKLPANGTGYFCSHCGLPKSTAEALVDHLANVHGDE